MIKVTVQRNLIALEDLLIGVGTVTQERGATPTILTLTKINGGNMPYDEEFSMKDKIDDLQMQIDTLPEVVDEFGNLLTGLINTSNLDLNLAGRLWRKTIDANTAEIYYGTQLLFQYNPTLGNLIIPADSDYIAADAVVTAAFEAADSDIIDTINALTASLGTAANEDVGTATGDVVQLEDVDGSPGLPAVDGSQLTGIVGVPIGCIVYAAYETPDAGFMKCNGASLLRTDYPVLFSKIGTTYGAVDGTHFNLPEPRGEFIRVMDDGRGVDTGRALGVAQSELLGAHSHAHSLGTSTTGAHTHTVNQTGTGGGLNTIGPQNGTNSNIGLFAQNPINSNGDHSHTITGAISSTGGAENRPRNVAFYAHIRVE